MLCYDYETLLVFCYFNLSTLTSPGGLLERPVLPLEPPLVLLLLPHLVVGHLLDRVLRRVRRQLRQGPVERQPERLAQPPPQLRNRCGVQTTISGVGRLFFGDTQ